MVKTYDDEYLWEANEREIGHQVYIGTLAVCIMQLLLTSDQILAVCDSWMEGQGCSV